MACNYQEIKLVVFIVMMLAIMVGGDLPINRGGGMGMDHIVGGALGWSLEADYVAWAHDQHHHIRVGDKLVFKYTKGDHNVINVDEAGFTNCEAPSTAEVLKSGEDVIPLTTPGKKWYICGSPEHCKVANQKLEINVLPQLQDNGTSAIDSKQATPESSSGNIRRGVAVSYAYIVIFVAVRIVEFMI